MVEVASRILIEQPTLVVRGKVRTDEIADFLGRAYSLVERRVEAEKARMVGPPFARYRPLDDEFHTFEVEAGFALTEECEGEGEVESSSLPGGTAAVAMHIGPYDQMKPVYDAIIAWIGIRGGVLNGVAWESYLSDPNESPDPNTWRTEVVQPYI